MHKSILAIAAAMPAALITALPASASDYTDFARVMSSTPIVERVREPRLECTPETLPQNLPPQERSVIAPIIGGVAGALLGNTVGRGSGRHAATAAGAIVGAVIGDHVGNQQTVAAAPVERCRTVETTRETVRGYTVVYQYNGRDISTTMPYDPGPTVRVGVTALDGAGVAAAAPVSAAMAGNTREIIVERHQPTRHLPPPGYGY